MTALEAARLAERATAVQRHVRRVEARLPEDPADLAPMSDATDAVVLHLWQATQIVIDQAVSASVGLGLGSPASYAEAFRSLAAHGVIDAELAERLARAAGFRNLVVHGSADLLAPLELQPHVTASGRHPPPTGDRHASSTAPGTSPNATSTSLSTGSLSHPLQEGRPQTVRRTYLPSFIN